MIFEQFGEVMDCNGENEGDIVDGEENEPLKQFSLFAIFVNILTSTNTHTETLHFNLTQRIRPILGNTSTSNFTILHRFTLLHNETTMRTVNHIDCQSSIIISAALQPMRIHIA